MSGVSPAMQALYDGDRQRARELLGGDAELDVFHAATFGRERRLRELLDADLGLARAWSRDGFTALHLAAFTDEVGAAQLLIERGADLEACSRHESIRARPLNTAAFARAHNVAELLLRSGANPNGTGEAGFTPLHAAAQHGDGELARILLERGADPDATTDEGRTPRDLAQGRVAELRPA